MVTRAEQRKLDLAKIDQIITYIENTVGKGLPMNRPMTSNQVRERANYRRSLAVGVSMDGREPNPGYESYGYYEYEQGAE